MKKFNRKFNRSRSGVSDIIGNLLILAITVTLFSSVLYFVTTIPTPAQATFADMEASITTDSDSVLISITHKGGQTLNNWSTGIYIFVNGAYNDELYVTSGGIADDKWETGDVWMYDQGYSGNLDALSMLIVDKNTNSIVWQANLIGGMTNTPLPPIIGNRWTVPMVGTQNKPLTFHITIIDPNDDLNYSSAHLDASYLNGQNNVPLTYDGGNMFSTTLTPTQIHEAGTTVIITASDLGGHTTRALMSVVVYEKASNNNSGGGTGVPPQNIDYSGLQGFNIFLTEDWDENEFDATPRTAFDAGDDVELVVVSKYLVNLDTENITYVMQAGDKFVVDTLELDYYDFYSGYYIFTTTIDTTGYFGNYLLQIQLKDSWIPNNVFFAIGQISVGGLVYPDVQIFYDNGFSQPYTESQPFEATDIIYFTVTTQYQYPWLQYGGDVIISDFFGNQQIKRIPSLPTDPPTTPLNPAEYVGQSANVYYFKVDLKKANQDPWLGGTNTYLLSYDIFKTYDSATTLSESYSLVERIKIEAPRFKMDIVAAIEFDKSAPHTSKDTMVYYENDNLWSPGEIIQGYPDRNRGAIGLFVETADMNGDRKNDIVAIVNGEGDLQLNLYLNDGKWTIVRMATLTGTPVALALGNIDFDNDQDVVVGFSNGKVTVFRNDGVWTATDLSVTGAAVTKLVMADLDNDRPTNVANRSLDVLVGRASGGIDVYKNADGVGLTWNYYKYDGQIITDQRDFTITGETPVTGTVTGTYTNLNLDDSIYEQIKEVPANQTGSNIPYEWWDTQTSPNIITSTQISVLQTNDNNYVMLDKTNNMIGVTLWALPPSIVNQSGTVTSIHFDYTYYTENAFTTQYIYRQGNPTGIPVTASTTLTTKSLYIDPVANGLTSINTVNGLGFYINIGSSNKNVYFDSWSLRVTMTNGSNSLTHILHSALTDYSAGTTTTYTLNINAHSSAVDQSFAVSVAKLLAGTYTPATIINGLVDGNFMFQMPTEYIDYTGPIYIKIVSVASSGYDQISNSVYLDKVSIHAVSTTTSTITAISGLAVYNLDPGSSDVQTKYRNEVVLIDSGGRLWIAHYSYVAPGMYSDLATPRATGILNAKDLGIGYVIGPKNGFNDILILTASNAYVLDQSSSGSFVFAQATLSANFASATGTVTSVCIGDVEGNGYLDFVVGTDEGYVVLFRNLLNDLWQIILIDHRYEAGSSSGKIDPYSIVDIGMGKLEED